MGSTSPLIFLIRHGEKPDKKDGEDQPGLSAQGKARAADLVQVFGKGSKYNIGLILAQAYKEKSGKRERPWLTVKPLVESLGSAVEHNHQLDRDDAAAVADFVNKWKQTGNGNILICWEHKALHDIAKALGVTDAPQYPSDRFDVIWTIQAPYLEIDSMTSEHTAEDGKYSRVA